ncbi:MAG: ParA family protein [Alphaproteobacteria bacterium]|nr:ParA family protein [Alphaproteobacteria bacterium]
MVKPRIFSVSNQKGGVGKTTTTVNLATALAALEKKVLIIDLDPQGNATVSVGAKRRIGSLNSYSVLTGVDTLVDSVLETEIPYLYVLPASKELLGVDIELASAEQPQFYLKNALNEINMFDYIFIDCPPAVGLLTMNALVASDYVIIPVQCEYLALEGVADLMKTVQKVKKNFNPNLQLHGIVLTMFDGRSNLSKSIVSDVKEFFKDQVYDTLIPRNVRIPEAPSHGKPVMIYDIRSVGAKSYIRLAAEVLNREKELMAHG